MKGCAINQGRAGGARNFLSVNSSLSSAGNPWLAYFEMEIPVSRMIVDFLMVK